MKQKVILTVEPLSDAKKTYRLGIELALLRDLKALKVRAKKVYVVLTNDNPQGVSIRAIKTYNNWGKLVNPMINKWIYNNGLNNYMDGFPRTIRFSLEISGDVNIYGFEEIL
jgi:hypothetical protein